MPRLSELSFMLRGRTGVAVLSDLMSQSQLLLTLITIPLGFQFSPTGLTAKHPGSDCISLI